VENLRKKLIYSAVLIIALTSVSCSPSHDSALGLGSNDQFIPNPTPNEALKTAAQTVLTNSCFACHGPSGSNTPLFQSDGTSVDMDALALNTNYVSIGNPGNSFLYNSIFEVPMPGSPPADTFFSDGDDQEAVFDWIADLGIPDPNAGDDDDGGGGGADGAKATFDEVERLVLEPSCYDCHATSQPVFTNYISVVSTIAIPNSTASSFLTSMRSGSMPQGQAPIDDALIDLVESWILDGAPDN